MKVVVGRRTSRMEVDSGHWMVKIVVPAVRTDQERGCDMHGVEKWWKWIRMTGRWCGRASCLWVVEFTSG